MHKKFGQIKYLYLAILGISTLGLYVNTLVPKNLLTVGGCIGIVSCTLFFGLQFLWQSTKRSLLYSSCLGVFLVLRYAGLRDLLYPLLLLVLLILLEVYWQKQ